MPLVESLPEGPLDIVGDVHGELDVLRQLLAHLGYAPDGAHPAGRRAVFVGDLCDRGHDSPGVIELVAAWVARGRAHCLLGNHELNLLRRAPKQGNRWYLDPAHPEQRGRFARSRPATAEQAARYHAFFLGLPLALERDDLRIVHAAWHAPAIAALRDAGGTSLDAYLAHDHAVRDALERDGTLAAAAAEQAGWDLEDEARPVPFMPALARRDAWLQMGNPVRVVTSGLEARAAAPFTANGKWRMCDRVRWWDAYADATPVIVGHYWRLFDDDTAADVSGGKPNLFSRVPAHAWVGARGNVFCVDFSIGGRHRELAAGATVFKTRLGAVRWPEGALVLDDGTALPLTR